MTLHLKRYKHLDTITVLFVAVLLISNVAATKITDLGPFTFDAGTLLFPLSYIFGDILTEVYGYKRSRKVIWLGFVSALLMSLTFMLVAKLPAAADWPFQQDYMNILGLTPRIVLASLVAFLAGEFSNAATLAKMKVATKGKHLWARTIGSTIVGQAIDTVLFVTIAFGGLFPIWAMIVSNYIFKTLIEIVFTPITYWVVGFLKKAEREDVYDKKTNLNPFNAS